MHGAFEIVIVVVVAAGVLLAATPWFWPGRALATLGRSGLFWLDHRDDLPIDRQPDEDARDAPLPRRPLRGRP